MSSLPACSTALRPTQSVFTRRIALAAWKQLLGRRCLCRLAALEGLRAARGLQLIAVACCVGGGSAWGQQGGTVLDANLRNWDLAVDGSPSSSTLMSPLRWVPSGILCNGPTQQETTRACRVAGTLRPLPPTHPVVCRTQQDAALLPSPGWMPCVLVYPPQAPCGRVHEQPHAV